MEEGYESELGIMQEFNHNETETISIHSSGKTMFGYCNHLVRDPTKSKILASPKMLRMVTMHVLLSHVLADSFNFQIENTRTQDPSISNILSVCT
jgi:hypothetical protein